MEGDGTSGGPAGSQGSMLVTGGANGLGAAIARLAADRGYRVSIVDVQPADWVDPRSDIRARLASVDDEAAIEELFEELGAPDVVVNNAGIVRFAPLVTARIEDFRAVVDVNLVGTFIVARASWRDAGSPADDRGASSTSRR